MSLIDFLAFIAAMIFLIISSRQAAKRRKEQPVDTGDTFEEHEEAHIRELEDFMLGKKKEAAASRLPSQAAKAGREKLWPPKAEKKAAKIAAPPAYRPSGKEAYERETDVFSEIRQSATNVYALTKRDKSSRAWHLVQQLKSTKQMVVLHDIFAPPKGLS